MEETQQETRQCTAKERRRQRYLRCLEQGICPYCEQRPRGETNACELCREYNRGVYKRLSPEKQDQRRAKQRDYDRRRRQERPDELREAKRRRYESIRLEAIAAYGGKCQCCGETESQFLSFDHVNGGGREHRSKVGQSIAFYYSLKKEGYPETIQLLCFNCHLAKDFRGWCPHQRPAA